MVEVQKKPRKHGYLEQVAYYPTKLRLLLIHILISDQYMHGQQNPKFVCVLIPSEASHATAILFFILKMGTGNI